MGVEPHTCVRGQQTTPPPHPRDMPRTPKHRPAHTRPRNALDAAVGAVGADAPPNEPHGHIPTIKAIAGCRSGTHRHGPTSPSGTLETDAVVDPPRTTPATPLRLACSAQQATPSLRGGTHQTTREARLLGRTRATRYRGRGKGPLESHQSWTRPPRRATHPPTYAVARRVGRTELTHR